ncbi:MAG: 30S ribosomal protein S6 [Candidatus Omnitrophica bacterium]|nr:30S ribosomal protein S6 [Candidatus Omnitrophota bacterium]
MEKSELIRKYELVMIVDAKSTNEAKEAIRKEVTDVINKHGGKVINSQVWLEKHKLTFQIKKCSEGTYYVINFEGQSEIINKIRPSLKLNEKILRFDFIKVEPKATAEAARA